MITVVSITLLEEAPGDLKFFWKVGGWIELATMFAIFFTTFFWSLRGGIMVGIAISLIRLMKHATRPRIQILGRIPGTSEFDNAEVLAQEGLEGVELVPHCLIVKIPEPLTFANTGSLKDRLQRLESYGTQKAHPALPSVRSRKHNQNLIFDIHGVTGMDHAAAQVFYNIVQDYINRGTKVFFCRVPSRKNQVWKLFQASGIVDLCGGEKNFYRTVEDALRATERTSTFHQYMEQTGQAQQSDVDVEEGGFSSETASVSQTVAQRDDDASFKFPSEEPEAGASEGQDLRERTGAGGGVSEAAPK